MEDLNTPWAKGPANYYSPYSSTTLFLPCSSAIVLLYNSLSKSRVKTLFLFLFNRSRAFRQAWGLGSKALGEGAFSEDT